MRPSSILSFASFLCLFAVVACGDDAAPPAEVSGSSGQSGQSGASGASGSAGSAGAFVEPTPPAPPVLTPCPERWTETTLPSGVVACEPGPLPDWTCPVGWKPRPLLEGTPRQYSICEPPELPDSCPEGTMPVLGESECQPIGDPCPAGDFPEGLPGDKPILYVKAGASGGDGSEGKPFGKISEAVQKAGKGAVVAIAKGLYPEAIAVGAGKEVSLWGACAAEVTIEGPKEMYPAATLEAKGSSVTKSKLEVRSVTVAGKRVGIVYVNATGKLEGVVIKEAEATGIAVTKAALDIRSVLVKDTQPRESDKTGGRGLNCQNGAQVSVERSLFDHNRELGVFAAEKGTSLTMRDVVVRDTQSRESDKTGGRGLECQTGAQVMVERALFDHNREVGMAALKAGTMLTMRDVVVRDTQPRESNLTLGRGLNCEEGAQVTVERSLFDLNREHGVFASEAGTALTMTDVVVENTQSRESDRNSGRGLNCQAGAKVKVERSLFDHNREFGVTALNAETTLTMRDAVVRDTQSQESDKTGGRGLNCQNGAQVSVERSLFDHNRDFGVFASEAGTALTMTDVVVENTQSRESDRTGGRGLHCQTGARVKVERSLFDHNRELGVFAAEKGTSLTMRDVVVRDTQSRESNLTLGLGLSCLSGSEVTVERALFDHNRQIGVIAFDTGTVLEMTDVVVRDTQSQESDKINGQGLQCQEGAQVSVKRSLFDHNREIGVFAFGAGTSLMLSDALVQDTLARESNGEYGVGLSAAGGASLSLLRVLVRQNHVAALLLLANAQASLSSVWLADTLPGNFTPFNQLDISAKIPIKGVGDGLVALSGSSVTATGLLSSGHQRSGLLFVDSSGTLSSTSSTSNQFGLVLRGTSQPSHDETCSFEGNETPILPDGDLPVPNAPLQTPPPLD